MTGRTLLDHGEIYDDDTNISRGEMVWVADVISITRGGGRGRGRGKKCRQGRDQKDGLVWLGLEVGGRTLAGWVIEWSKSSGVAFPSLAAGPVGAAS
jgi:hypothetical protein